MLLALLLVVGRALLTDEDRAPALQPKAADVSNDRVRRTSRDAPLAHPDPEVQPDDHRAGADCSEARDQLALITAVSPAYCATELRDLGCHAPLAHPDAPQAAATVLDDIVTTFAGCDAFTTDALVVDCTEYPCVVAIRREALALECAPALAFAEVAQSPEELGGGAVWADWAAFSSVDMPDPDGPIASTVHARYEARTEVLARTLREHGRIGADSRPPVVLEPPCEAVQHALDLHDDERPCEAIAFAWGCTGAAPRLPPSLVEAHEEHARAWVEELETSCASFAGVLTYELDCDGVPCLLGFIRDPADGGAFTDTLCGHTAILSARGIHLTEDGPEITVVALWDDEVQDDALAQERWRIEQDMRRWRLARRLVGDP